MERLFLTGGSGFIRINVTECFLKAGTQVYNCNCYNVAGYVEVYFGRLGGDYRSVQGDMLDGERLRLSLGESGADTVIHIVVITVTEGREENGARHIFDVNCKGTSNMLDASAAAGIRRPLYVSSIAVYGTTAYKADILAEEMESLNSENLYQVSKLTSEKSALRCQYPHHMDITCTRLGDVFGLRKRPTRSRGKMSVPCTALKYAMDGIQAVLKRPNRTSWMYSGDITGALFWPAGKSPEWDVYNLSPSGIWSITDWCQASCSYYPGFKWRLAGREKESNAFYHGIRDNAPMSVSRFCESGYMPQYDMEKTMKDYIAWAEEYPQMLGKIK